MELEVADEFSFSSACRTLHHDHLRREHLLTTLQILRHRHHALWRPRVHTLDDIDRSDREAGVHSPGLFAVDQDRTTPHQ